MYQFFSEDNEGLSDGAIIALIIAIAFVVMSCIGCCACIIFARICCPDEHSCRIGCGDECA